MQIAIKVLTKSKFAEGDLEQVKSEFQLLQHVDHPNIVKYLETYDDSRYMYLCMEYCPGGGLFKKITD